MALDHKTRVSKATTTKAAHKRSQLAGERRDVVSAVAKLVQTKDAQIRALTEAVKEAARLLHDVLYEKGCSADPAITAWLSRPIVKASEGK